MDDLKVDLKLDHIHCFDEGDGPGNAEPYLWTVFFKVDGETVVVNTDGPAPPFLQGFPVVVGTPGNHGNLLDTDVDEDDDVPVPAIIGEYHTTLKPIPLTTPIGSITEVGGLMGCLVVLMEEDDTPNDAIAAGHNALDSSVRDKLASFLSSITLSHATPTDEDIAALSDSIGAAVKAAIKDEVSVLDWIGAFGNMDDQIGSAVFRFSHDQLASSGGMSFSRRWENEGDWEIFGSIKATKLPKRVDPCCRELREEIKKLQQRLTAEERKTAAIANNLSKNRTTSRQQRQRPTASAAALR